MGEENTASDGIYRWFASKQLVKSACQSDAFLLVGLASAIPLQVAGACGAL